MDIAWDQYKPILRRAYFGDSDSSLAPRDSDAANDFWAFFKKYLAVVARKNIRADDRSAHDRGMFNELGIPEGSYQKLHRPTTQLHIDKTARYMLRELPSRVVNEFEYIIHCYLEFCQKDKLVKLKKLRTSQANLPITARRSEILKALETHNVLLIAGDTGCGKSTQVPQYLLAAGYDKIGCTQPRRIACISLAKRVAFETLNEYGTRIAYQIRFERTKTQATRMLFLTEGLLLRQMSADPKLETYNVLILDEIHERHLQGDFLMGLLRELVSQRKDLKLILMSATINLELFTEYFKDAPVIKVPGRLYPIVLQYFPTPASTGGRGDDDKKKAEKIDPAPYVRILQMVDKKFQPKERGDALIFLSGISEITIVAEALKIYAEQSKLWIILMLHSTLSLEEQDKVFDSAPEGVRKCILSTNIAETSVTIDGIRFVVDSGKVKQMKYDATTRMHQLKEMWVSQASAEQRKGRAGRTGPGICYRLYSNEQYDAMDKYTTSEIQRVSLESLALQMYHLEFAVEPRKFPFIEPPNSDALEEAIESLKDQGALCTVRVDGTVKDELTPLGKMLVNLPVDVSIGKMLIMGCLFRQVEAVLTVAAGLSVQSPFTNRSYRDLDCLARRRNLISDHGDPFALINTYREWLQVKADGAEASRRWCRQRGLEEQRLYEITKLRRQFKELLEDGELIEKRSLSEMGAVGSAERRIKAGETKKLRDLKRKARFEERKRKVLKPDQHFDSIMDEVERAEEEREDMETSTSRTSDVHSIEFSMSHSASELNDALKQHRMNHESASLIKFILCSGLYPQYALLDQHNSYKLGNDLMAHTRGKLFVVLHPNGCLAQDPEVLAYTLDKEQRSANHQLIFYGLLLETTKPYLCNTVRVPALHILLLFARRVHSSSDFTRVVCDDFIEFLVADGDKGAKLLAAAADIRKLFADCLERKLSGDAYHSSRLSKRLIEYMSMEVVFGVKKLAQSERSIGRKRDEDTMDEGMVIGCLPGASEVDGSVAQYLTTKWTCEYCGEDFYSAADEKLIHLRQCRSDKEAEEQREEAVKAADEPPQRDGNPLKRDYFCPECDAALWLSAVEILRHKRSHAASSSSSSSTMPSA